MFQRIFISIIALLCFGDSIAQRKECPYFLRLRIITETSLPLINKEDSAIAIDRKPAEGAEVFVELSHSIAHADADGYATLKGLCSTTTDVEINYQGKHHHLIFLSKSPKEIASGDCYVVILNGDGDSSFVIPRKHLPRFKYGPAPTPKAMPFTVRNSKPCPCKIWPDP